MWPLSASYLTVINQKRSQRARILQTAPLFTNEHHDFLRATATEIVERIKNGEWTATQVLEAFIARAKVAHEQTNCLTEVMFDWAREQAGALDTDFSRTGKLKGPLHGVPVSIKDQFEIKGYDATVGFTRWANNPAKENADVVNILLEAGAVICVKTNIPQTMFAFECSNPLWGRTTNPYNNNYTSGGSSGGEAALVSMDGSALGVGTDIGGSLRIPVAYCGAYSLKPGTQRITYGGAKGPDPGFEGIKTVAGPIGRSIEDLELFSRLTFGVQGRNHDIPPVPFRDIQLPSKLKFGYYTSDDFVKSSPACKRAVLESVNALRKQGHECIEIEIPSTHKAFEIFAGITSAGAYRTLLSHVGPDPLEPALRLVRITPRLPSFIRRLAASLIELLFSDKWFANVVRIVHAKSMPEYNKLIHQRNVFAMDFHKEVFGKYNIDGIIAPVQALPQLPHGGCNNFIALAESTALYNILDCPVGIVPVTRVDSQKDAITEEWWKEPGHGSKIIETGLFKGKNCLYKPEEMNGMPIGIQLIGERWKDEKVLAMMKVVDTALGKERGFGPAAWDKHLRHGSKQNVDPTASLYTMQVKSQ